MYIIPKRSGCWHKRDAEFMLGMFLDPGPSIGKGRVHEHAAFPWEQQAVVSFGVGVLTNPLRVFSGCAWIQIEGS